MPLCLHERTRYFSVMSTEHFGDVITSMREVLLREVPEATSLYMATTGLNWSVKDGKVCVWVDGVDPRIRVLLQKAADRAVWDAERRLRHAVSVGCTKMRDLSAKPVQLGLPRQWKEGLVKVLRGVDAMFGQVHEQLYCGMTLTDSAWPVIYSSPEIGRYVLLELVNPPQPSSEHDLPVALYGEGHG